MKIKPRSTCAGSMRANILPVIEQRLGPIEYRGPGSLKVYAGNPRKHPEKQIVKLAASIEHFGFALPVLIGANGEIIAGEARVKAAERLGIAEIPVLVAAFWSEAQIRAYRLLDNKLPQLASWDTDALAIELSAVIEFDETPTDILGWETAEIDVVLGGSDVKGAGNDPADDIPEPPEIPVSRAGDLWLLGAHRLLCSSSLETESWAALMAGRLADMAFTDPPYGVKVDGHVCGLGKIKHAEFAMGGADMTRGQYREFLTEAIGCLAACLRDGAVAELCIDWRHYGEMLAAIEANGLEMLNLAVWNKTNAGMGSLLRSKHELVLIAKQGKASHVNNVQLGKYGRYRTNVWDYPGVNAFGKSRMDDLAAHPTCKPVALIHDALLDVTRPGDCVIDGFIGSGSTILAAERAKRVAYGIEIEPRFVDVAIARWQKMTGAPAVLEATGETFADIAAARGEGTLGEDHGADA